MAPAALSFLAGLVVPLLGAVNTAPIALVDLETAVGSAPTDFGAPPTATFAATLTPAVGARVDSNRFRLRVSGGPRLRYQTPNMAGVDRVLTLWLVSADSSYSISERTTWLANAEASEGEVEYSSARLALGTPVSGNLPSPVLDGRAIRGRTGIETELSRRYRLTVAAFADYVEPHDTETTALPGSTGLGGEITQAYLLDPRTSFLLPVSAQYRWVRYSPNEPNLLLVTAGIGFTRLLDPRTTLESIGGVAVAGPKGEPVTVAPRVLASLERILHERLHDRVINRLAVAYDSSYDPSLGGIYSAVTGQLSLQADLNVDWSLGAAAGGYIATELQPQIPSFADISADASIWVGRRLTRGVTIQVGSRYAARSTRSRPRGLTLLSREVWAFANLHVEWDGSQSTQPTPPP